VAFKKGIKNPRVNKREQGLLKGALRRVFARSELRNKVLKAAIVKHSDSSRPRVKTWVKCKECGKLEAKSYMVVDHIDPLIPLNSSFEEMSVDEVINRLWCDEKNLQVLCKDCHNIKTKQETKIRRKK
jgi:5-methylcytosine-specific restriction endonuclease McrA